MCRGCTGHLMLVKRITIQVAVEETPSTDREEPKQPNPQTTQQTKTKTNKNNPKTGPQEPTATWCATQPAMSAKMREGETGAMYSAFALSTSLPQRGVDQHSSDIFFA